MGKVLVNDTTLTGIANAIREKNGETATYLPSEMAQAIAAISTGPDWDWGKYNCVMGSWTPTENTVVFDYSPYVNVAWLVFIMCPELYADGGHNSSDPNKFGVQFLFGSYRDQNLIGDVINKDGIYSHSTIYAGLQYGKLQLTLPSIADPDVYFPAGKTYNFILIAKEVA